MPPMSKTRRLPFKPPSRISAAGASSSAGPSTTKKRATTGNASSSGSQPKRRNVRAAPVPEPLTLESESETEDPASPVAPTLKSPASDLFVSESPSPEPEPDYILAEITTTGNNDEDIMTSEPKIPSKLLTALLHHHFQDDKTRVTKDAAKLYAKYIDIFVREAVARAVYERKEKLETETFGSTRIQTMADSFLEVEDLEKLVPQLLLDF